MNYSISSWVESVLFGGESDPNYDDAAWVADYTSGAFDDVTDDDTNDNPASDGDQVPQV
jgi:hypothetical protein